MSFDLTPYRHYWTKKHAEDTSMPQYSSMEVVDWVTVDAQFTAADHKILLHSCDALVIHLVKLGLLQSIRLEVLLWAIRRNYPRIVHMLIPTTNLFEQDPTRCRRINPLITAAHFGRPDIISMLTHNRQWHVDVVRKAYVRAASIGCHQCMYYLGFNISTTAHGWQLVGVATYMQAIKAASCHGHINVLERLVAGSDVPICHFDSDSSALGAVVCGLKAADLKVMQFIFKAPRTAFGKGLIDRRALGIFICNMHLYPARREMFIILIRCQPADTIHRVCYYKPDWLTFLSTKGTEAAVRLYAEIMRPGRLMIMNALEYCEKRSLRASVAVLQELLSE